MATGPGLLSVAATSPFLMAWFQHPMACDFVVVGIQGFSHQVAARSVDPSSTAETICHGGTSNFDGLEMSMMSGVSVSFLISVLLDFSPSASARLRTSTGPPFLKICGWVRSVTTLAL